MANQLLTSCPEKLILDEIFSCTFFEDYSINLPTTGLLLNSAAIGKAYKNAAQLANGQTQSVKIQWNAEFCGEAEDGCVTDICDAPAMDLVQAEVTVPYDPCAADNSGHFSFKVPFEEFRQFNELMSKGPVGATQLLSASSANSSDSIQVRLYQAMKKLELQAEEKLAAKLVDLIIDATGGFSKKEIDNASALGLTFSTTAGIGLAKEVKTFGAVETAAKSNFNDAMSEVRESARQARFCANPIIIGGKAMEQYISRLDAGCCASNGFDIAQYARQYNFSFLRNDTITDLIGNNHFMSVELGALQHLGFLKYQGNFGWNFQTSKATTITSPWTGRMFDMTWKFDDCNGYVVYTLSYNESLFDIPQHYCAGDHREGVNGLQLFKIVNS